MTLRRAIVTLAVIAGALAVLRFVTKNLGGAPEPDRGIKRVGASGLLAVR